MQELIDPCLAEGMRCGTRGVDYLRISVTDRCNLRCMYCMPPGGIGFENHDGILTFEEIVRVVTILSGMGIRKIRITGGEPLVRRGLSDLIFSINEIDAIDEVSITTNGILLSRFSSRLHEAGIRRINVSLDTLRRDRFATITGRDMIDRVLEGIEKARECGISPIKINTVIMKNVNDDEIIDFIHFALSKGLILRFIEFMKVTPLWKSEYFLPVDLIRERCEREFNLVQVAPVDSGPANYYSIGNEGMVGFIKTDTGNCRKCTRLRLLSNGVLKICLYEKNGLPLRNPMRNGSTGEMLRDRIRARIDLKEGSTHMDWRCSQSYMCSLGG